MGGEINTGTYQIFTHSSLGEILQKQQEHLKHLILSANKVGHSKAT